MRFCWNYSDPNIYTCSILRFDYLKAYEKWVKDPSAFDKNNEALFLFMADEFALMENKNSTINKYLANFFKYEFGVNHGNGYSSIKQAAMEFVNFQSKFLCS